MNRMVPIMLVAAWVPSFGAAPPVAQEPKVFARANLVAWCIVPFDGKNRGPAERAAMLKRLGFTKVAYDWRDQHVPSFEEEILQYRTRTRMVIAVWALGVGEQTVWPSGPSPPGGLPAAAQPTLPGRNRDCPRTQYCQTNR